MAPHTLARFSLVQTENVIEIIIFCAITSIYHNNSTRHSIGNVNLGGPDSPECKSKKFTFLTCPNPF